MIKQYFVNKVNNGDESMHKLITKTFPKQFINLQRLSNDSLFSRFTLLIH